jgi:hypothetical protein
MRHGASGILAVAFVLGAICPAAAAYRWIDDDGVVHLSDGRAHVETSRRRATPDQNAPVPEPPPPGSTATPSELSKFKERTELRRMESVTTEVMRLSGLTVQVDLLAVMILGEFDRLRGLGLQPAAGATPVIAQTFGAEPLRSNMQEALSRSLNTERTRTLLSWLRSSLSQRIVALECVLPTAERQTELIDFVNQLPSRPPSPARLMLIHRLERATDATEGSAVVLAAAGAALRKTLRPFVSPAAMAQPEKGGPKASPSPTPTVDDNARFRTMVSLLFTYRDLSDADLGRYVSFLESPTGRWFTRIVQSAFLTSLDPFDQPKPARASAPGVKRPRVSEAAVAADSSD